MKRLFILAISILFFSGIVSNAQTFGVKSNILYWTAATPNVGLELSVAPRWTIEFEGAYNPWTFDKKENMKAKHWLVSPEVRYWFCESFIGHFIGINANYTQFNIGAVPVPFQKAFVSLNSTPYLDLSDSRSEGWAAGAGITYGFAFPVARRWNIEFTAGLGYWYSAYDQFESRKCGLFQQTVQKHAIGLSSLGVSFIYMIK
jgi:hypothetical protein